MTFGAPLNLFWIIPAAGAIVALYLLRRPRRNITVPSTFFWRMMPQTSVRAMRVQPLKPQLLLFLQIAAAILLVLAAAQPRIRHPQRSGTSWAIVIDNGAGMNAVDVSGGRLAAAKALARQLIARQVLPGDSVCIVSTAPARLDAGLSVDRSSSSASMDAIEATDAGADIVGAVSDAATALGQSRRNGAPTRIVLFSSGAWPAGLDGAVQKAAAAASLSLVDVGSPSAKNIAISRLEVARDPADPSHSLQVFIEIASFGSASDGVISLSAGGRVFGSRRVSAAPGRPADCLFRIAAPHDREVAVARLNARLGDDLADDDTAYAILPAAGGVRVLLVSAGDPPLEKVLGLLPGVEVDEASPSSYAGFGAVSGYDVYVLDGVDPIAGRPIPGGAFIWGGADPQFTTAGGGDTSVPVVDWDRSQPVMRFDDLSDTLLRAPAWGSVGAWSPLIEDSQGIVAAAIENGTQRQVRVSFTPQSSGFSTQAAFPIFVSNAITWLAEQAGQSAPAGTPIALAPEPGGWTVTGPAGKQAGLCDQFGSACSVSQTQPAGIYSVHSSGGDLLFTRNTDASESDIVPKAHAIATAPLAVSAPNLSRVIWVQATWAVAALCLCLLIAEWLVYHRPSRPGQRPARK